MKKTLFFIIIAALIVVFWSTVITILKWIAIVIGLFLSGRMLLHFISAILSDSADYLDSRLIILGLFGTVPVVYWLFIPYWGICQWVLYGVTFALCILFHIYYCNIIIKKIFLGATLIWSGFLLTKYVVIPYWDIVSVILVVIGIIIGLTIVYFISKSIYDSYVESRRKRIEEQLKKIAEGMPIPENAVFDTISENCAKKAIRNLEHLYNKINNANDEIEELDYKQQLFEEKLHIFYEISLRAESKDNNSAYIPFKKQYEDSLSSNDIRKLRVLESNEELIIQKDKIKSIKSKIEKDREKNYESKINSIRNMDVQETGRFLRFLRETDTDKLHYQTERFQDLYNQIIEEANAFMRIQTELNDELTKIRLTVYRNTYLGIEVVNYRKNFSKGKSITTEKGLFIHDSLEVMDIDFTSLSTDYNQLYNSAMQTFETSISSLSSFGIRPGRKTTIAMAFGAAAFSLWNDHERKVNENIEMQNIIVSNMNEVITELQLRRSTLIKTIGLIEKILNANKTFHHLYPKLRDKIFYTNESITDDDVDNLYRMIKVNTQINTQKL